MKTLPWSTLLGVSLTSALACSGTPEGAAPAQGGTAGALSSAGAASTLATAGSAGDPLAQAGGSAGGDVSIADGGAVLGEAGSAGSIGIDDPDVPPAGWTLTWSDEFDGPAGQQIDPKKWKYQNSASNVNNELEYYTNRPANSGLDGQGHMLIHSLKEDYNGRRYTSAKFTTKGLFSQQYGRFEARIQLPAGKGLWPAFWALGTNDSAGWPACGEMDIMETIGNQLTINRGSLHGPGYSGGNPLTAQFKLTGGSDFSQDFHVFTEEWEENVVRFYVDNMLYETRTPKDLNGKKWVYDHTFYLIMNVAVGGMFPGNPDDSIFPRTMSIDYVRVYARSAPVAP